MCNHQFYHGYRRRWRTAMLTFFYHADSEAFLEAAELASVPSPLVHWAVLVRKTHVLGSLLNGSLYGGQTHGQLSLELAPACGHIITMVNVRIDMLGTHSECQNVSFTTPIMHNVEDSNKRCYVPLCTPKKSIKHVGTYSVARDEL